jgi:hypothetical protein
MHGAEDFHQRGFARAVLAAQRNDFAASDLKADVVERNHAGKALADSAHFGERRHGSDTGDGVILQVVSICHKVFSTKKKVAVPKHRHLFETDGLPELDVEQDDAAHDNQA